MAKRHRGHSQRYHRKIYTNAQRAAYWKKKYLDLLKEMKGWI